MKFFFLVTVLASICFAGEARMTTTASVGTTSVLVLQKNRYRRGLVIYNNSSNSVYVSFSTTANSANKMTAIIPTFNQWTAPEFYIGPVSAIRNAGSGVLMITEVDR